jgi:hypothetical protein
MSHLANQLIADNKIDMYSTIFPDVVESEDTTEQAQALADVYEELEEWDAEQELFNDHTR